MNRSGFDRRDLALIAIGGLVGATLRWWITDLDPATNDGGWFAYAPNTTATPAQPAPGIPWRVLAVNLLGTFVLGAVLVLRSTALGTRRLWLTIGTGFCGSLTTFSTFAVDIVAWWGPPSGPISEGTGLDDFQGFGDGWTVNGLWRDPAEFRRTAILYLALSLIGAVVAFVAGRRLGKAVAR
ncbi:MAG: CrcB family protein [Actinomycetota bacterium]